MKPLFHEQITRERREIGDYVSAAETNLQLTFARIRREQAKAKAKPCAPVITLNKVKK